MEICMKERYNELKESPRILVTYSDILSFYPDYYKKKVELENMEFFSKEEIDADFETAYDKTDLYDKLVELGMAKDEIHDVMSHNKDLKYDRLKAIFEALVKSSIDLCDLIDYIGHYPTTYPVPKEEEKDPRMEALLDKADIMVRYYAYDDIDEMQIMSDDVVRIIEKLSNNLYGIDLVSTLSTTQHYCERHCSDEALKESTKLIIDEINTFPPSCYQMEGKSHREEGKMYLRKQHGKNVI